MEYSEATQVLVPLADGGTEPLGQIAPLGRTAIIVVSGGPPVESDIRLKRDIAQVGELDSGINLYRYRYLWSDTTYVGVMAHEVAAVKPDAVQRGADGYMRVDYARLGLRLRTWDQWTQAHRRQRAHNHRRIAANSGDASRRAVPARA